MIRILIALLPTLLLLLLILFAYLWFRKSKLPTIVFCTTCKGRVQHIQKTLPENIKSNKRYKNLKFVILDYNSSDNLLDYLGSNYDKLIKKGRLVVYSFKDEVPFHMTHAKNMAHRLGMMEGADILVNLDADNLTGTGFAKYIEKIFRDKNNIFLCAGVMKGRGKRFRGCSGRIAVEANTFLKVGGYDEKYDTWAPDDKDFTARLQKLGYVAHEIDRQFLEAIPHSDGMRFLDYPHIQADDSLYEIEMINVQNTTIANFGHLGEGVVFRNFGSTPIVLGPLPTRIFGIGMHKTATNSLHAALKILGFDSEHWRNPKRAKAIWREMRRGRSLTIEKNYASCDLPITLLYEQLDHAYPGSKFILTTRDENMWLESVKNHWSYSQNEFRESWDSDPITHVLHDALYGTTTFNAEIFLARYRKHNADVKEYFKDRQDDLLIMEMDNNAGWIELCNFLDKPIPAVDYPWKFTTKGR